MLAHEIANFEVAIRELQENLGTLLESLNQLREQNAQSSPQFDELCACVELLVMEAEAAFLFPEHLVATRH